MTTLLDDVQPDAQESFLERCRQADEQAWAELFSRYHAFVRRSARRLGIAPAEVDDVEQEVFAVAFRHIRRFERGRITTWLFTLVSNVVSNRQRSTRVRARFLEVFASQPSAPSRTPEHHWERREAQRVVRAVLARMSPKKRDVFALFELEGLSGEEVAGLLDIELNTVWTRLHHARKDFERLARRAGVAS